MTNKLSKDQEAVLKYRATEYPGTGKLLHNKAEGKYVCAECSTPLFSSDHKFDSNSGWPSFYDLANEGSVMLEQDDSYGMHRAAVACSKCGGHLGHVFDDAYDQPTGKRYCVNSASLCFEGIDGKKIQG